MRIIHRPMLGVAFLLLGPAMVCGQPTPTGSGQAYPSKTIRIITSEPGSSNDLTARLIAQGISGPLGRQVIVDNRAGVLIPADNVAKSAPDGYSIVLTGSTLWLAPFLQDNVPYDPLRDFAPITLATNAPNILTVHPSLPAKSVKELIAIAKARPGELNYAVSVPGGSVHLAAELFRTLTAAKMARVPFKGAGGALNALMGGEVQFMFPVAPAVMPHIKSGRLRGLAVTTAKPSALTPGFPTVAATVPGFEAGNLIGLFAPAKTPEAIVHRLNQEILGYLNRPEVKEQFFNAGVEIVGTSPEVFAAILRSEMPKWSKVIKEAGFRDE